MSTKHYSGHSNILNKRKVNFGQWFENFEAFAAKECIFHPIPAPVAGQEKLILQQENVRIFLMYVDRDIQQLLQSLCQPAAVMDKTYQELKKLLVDHMNALKGHV